MKPAVLDNRFAFRGSASMAMAIFLLFFAVTRNAQGSPLSLKCKPDKFELGHGDEIEVSYDGETPVAEASGGEGASIVEPDPKKRISCKGRPGDKKMFSYIAKDEKGALATCSTTLHIQEGDPLMIKCAPGTWSTARAGKVGKTSCTGVEFDGEPGKKLAKAKGGKGLLSVSPDPNTPIELTGPEKTTESFTYTVTDGMGCWKSCIITLEIKPDMCPDGSDTCGDPHMVGLRGQRINWSGVDGGWYCLLKDDKPDLQINIRVTAPLPAEFPDRQLITGLSILSGGHSVVVEVNDPYTVSTNGCPDDISPCLSDGGLRFTVDGIETAALGRPTRDELIADGIIVSSSNLPVECRQFGAGKLWARMYEEMFQGSRELVVESFEDWVLRFDGMAAPDWCTRYISLNGLVEVQSPYSAFKISTSSADVRLHVGIDHQDDGELDWDERALPELDFWQMDVGIEGASLDSESISGLLGETARPVVDENGREIMEGQEALRGTVEDYRVSGALGTDFGLLHKGTSPKTKPL